MIEFVSEDVKVPDFDSELFVLWLENVVKDELYELGVITIITCSDDYLLEVNKKFLDHDYYTDIITFDYTEDNTISGDLFISIDRVDENAETADVSFLDEFKRVCVHGVLHLCGYKDKTSEEVVEMRLKENHYLDKFVSRGTNVD